MTGKDFLPIYCFGGKRNIYLVDMHTGASHPFQLFNGETRSDFFMGSWRLPRHHWPLNASACLGLLHDEMIKGPLLGTLFWIDKNSGEANFTPHFRLESNNRPGSVFVLLQFEFVIQQT